MERALNTDEEDRLRIEQELRVSEERLRAIFNSEPECVKVLDLSGRVLDMNAAGLAMFEADSFDQIRGVRATDFVHPDDIANVQTLLDRAAAGEPSVLTFRILTLKGTERWGEGHASPLRAGTDHVNAVLAVTHDVTERRRAREERDLYAQAMRSMNVGLIILQLEHGVSGPSFRFVAANEAGLRATRTTEDELIGRTIAERFPAFNDAGLITRAVEALRTRTASLIGDFAYGDDRVPASAFHIAFAPISDRTLAVTFQDVTEQRHLEEQLRQSQKMEAVGRLAGGIAHDFNNLLTVIIGYLQAGLATEVSGELRSDLEQAQAAADRAARLTRQLLAFSRRQVLQPRVVDVDVLLRELHTMVARMVRENISLTLHLGAAGGCVKVDPGQLEQVVINLVVNACDAMPSGGSLILRTERVDGQSPDPVPYVRLTVSDNGSGMDDATRARIFEPFFTTKGEDGTGLGLSTVYGIVEQSGGCVTCESRLGEGSSFHVYLPLVSEAAQPADNPVPSVTSGHEAILVVEDQAALRRLMAISLEREGYRVDTAANGDEALALVQSGKHFDVLVTDLVMPGMNGRQVADAVSRLSPHTRIVFVSGYFHDLATTASFVHFLQKPFTPTALAAKVREAMESPNDDL